MRVIKSPYRRMDGKTMKLRRCQLNVSNFPSERWFEKLLKTHGVSGYRRNVPLGEMFFGDFVWRREKVVVEIDGPSHNNTQERDRWRDSLLTKQLHLRVIRVRWNDESGALSAIKTVKEIIHRKQMRSLANKKAGELQREDFFLRKRAETGYVPKNPHSKFYKTEFKKFTKKAQEEGLAKKWLEQKKLLGSD